MAREEGDRDRFKKGKKRKEAPSEAAAPAEPPVDASLARLRADSAFFDRLVSLVPAAFYLTGGKPGEGEPDVRYKHGAGEKASAKLRAKEGSKKAKRLKVRAEAA